MKGLKFLVLTAIACSLVMFSIGCAARQTVKQEAVATPETQAVVAEATAVPAVSMEKYVVKKGDTLWAISAKGSIYKDNFEWPLLFKANRDAIEDPDLIQVNQELVVKKDFAKDEVTDAVQKAKDTPPYKPHTAPRKKLPLRY
jgi:LysM repeat protein